MNTTIGALDSRRKTIILISCCLSLLIVSMDSTIVNVAIPSIRRDLGASVLELGGEPADLLADVDRLGVLHGGRLIQIDTPDRLWSSPVDLGVARLLGEVNVVTGRLARRLDGVVEVDTALGRLRATALDDLSGKSRHSCARQQRR